MNRLKELLQQSFHPNTLPQNGAIVLIWSILWFASGIPFLSAYPWVRFSLALLAFIYPGFRLQTIFNHQPLTKWAGHLSNGFLASIFLTGVLGATARLFQLSFEYVLWGLYLAGLLISLLCGELPPLKSPGQKFNAITIALALIPVGAAILAANIAIPARIFEDDFTYNALLNYYQFAEQYDFQFMQGLEQLEITRFWLAYWPLVEAVLAHLSGLHGLLITGIYLAPALVGLSLIGVYALGRALTFSHPIALLATVLQTASLIRLTNKNQAGLVFFDQLIEDKAVAAFVLVPIVIRLTIAFTEQPRRRRLALLFVGAIGLMFTHPIILGMTALVAAVYSALNFLVTRKISVSLLAILPFGLALIFPVILRFGEAEERYMFSVEEALESGRDNKLSPGRLQVLEDERFYGIDPSLVSGLPYELSLLAGMLSLLLLKKDPAARYTVSALTVLGISIFPYTGWMIGLGTSTFQLWRLTWMTPLGIILATLVNIGIKAISPRMERWKQIRITQDVLEWSLSAALQITLVIGMLYILPWAKGNLKFGITKPGTVLYYQDYIELNAFLNTLEQNGEFIIGGPDRPTNDIIPSLTYQLRLISFRDERGGKAADLYTALIGPDTSPSERHQLFQENEIRYLVIRDEPDWLFDWISSNLPNFELLFQTKKLSVFEFHPIK